jgi:hypothetical protein
MNNKIKIACVAIILIMNGSFAAFISKAIPGVRFEKNSNFITAILPDKETLNEGRYDSITRLVVKDIINSWKSQFNFYITPISISCTKKIRK